MESKVLILLFFLFNCIDLNFAKIIWKRHLNPFENAEVVVINQQKATTEKENKNNFCEIFPNVRNLEINIGNLNNRTFIDCEFHLLDELNLVGEISNETYDEIFKNFLLKNSRIQHISFKSPTNRRLFLFLKKYLRNLKHISIFDEVLDDDVENEIFMPSVRKLEINFEHSSNDCRVPMGITFGGDKLEELNLQCFNNDIDYKYFSTLYRYPNIKSLNLGIGIYNRDLLKIIGKFPLLTKAHFEVVKDDVTSDTIVKFMEKCDHLEEISFFFQSSAQLSNMRDDFKKRFSDKFTFTRSMQYDQLQLKRNKSNSKRITSGLVSFLIIIHICHAFFS